MECEMTLQYEYERHTTNRISFQIRMHMKMIMFENFDTFIHDFNYKKHEKKSKIDNKFSCNRIAET